MNAWIARIYYDSAVTPRERVEIFHLHFLRLLAGQLQDRSLVPLKGGGNLRFFFGSPRFSEDLDFDVRHVAMRTLSRKIDGILEGGAIERLLAASGLRISSWSAPKQTESVQRWKASIVEGSSAAESTKLEFSRRASVGDVAVDALPAPVLERHRLAGPVIAAHYGLDTAASQKVEALIGRSEPQTRDLFDLNLLLDRGAKLPKLDAKDSREARDRILEFTFDELEGQVLAFLEPAEAETFDRAHFEAIQLRVNRAIEETS